MITPLWAPSNDRIDSANITAFTKHLASQLSEQSYQGLYQFSVEQPVLFWQSLWDYCQINTSAPATKTVADLSLFPGASWFVGTRFNFAENLLGQANDDLAIISRLENGSRVTLTYKELHQQVAHCAGALKALGVVQGDRVAGFMPNISETIVAMLATTSIGAIWSSCSPDFGINGVIDRFGQIKPKVLFACDGYFYNGKTLDKTEQLNDIAKRINSIEKIVVVPVINAEPINQSRFVNYPEFLMTEQTPTLTFTQLSFDHPLYIMYSSGTTGAPKCIVHSAGGTLLQHLKEHRLHVDVKPQDKLFYFTTCGWMMWNWLVTGLASRATIVLYDGSPFYPEPKSLIDIIDQEDLAVFGTSAKYIAALEKEGVNPKKTHKLTSLKTILSTGSPLSHESFEYVYRDIKTDVCLSSISGGTDIISCFALGCPTLPVYSGELQCRGLGMAVEVWNDNGESVIQEKGELVCTTAFPACPIYFYNDTNNERFTSAYFEHQFDQPVWAHGDYAEITEHGGVVIHGRSDAVLNPGGVRIGTAEIYRQVEKVAQVLESVCIGQQWQDDVRVILFVVLRPGITLDEALIKTIKTTIRAETTPRHVPAKVIQVADIPRTISGKIVELAVRSIVHGKNVKNREALANPEALDLFSHIEELSE